ncbi:hypothetical protein ACVWY0_001284 [Arthrobacter sp. UYNi723]
MESVDVSPAPDGVPLSFVLQGRTWQVATDAVRWFERTPWWELVTSIPRGQSFKIDIEVWQLQAHEGSNAEEAELVTFVLVRDQNTGEWTVRSMNDIST